MAISGSKAIMPAWKWLSLIILKPKRNWKKLNKAQWSCIQFFCQTLMPHVLMIIALGVCKAWQLASLLKIDHHIYWKELIFGMAELKLMDNKFSTPKSEKLKNNLSLRSKLVPIKKEWNKVGNKNLAWSGSVRSRSIPHFIQPLTIYTVYKLQSILNLPGNWIITELGKLYCFSYIAKPVNVS